MQRPRRLLGTVLCGSALVGAFSFLAPANSSPSLLPSPECGADLGSL